MLGAEDLIKYSSKRGSDIYKQGITPLDDKALTDGFNMTANQTVVFTEAFLNCATAMGLSTAKNFLYHTPFLYKNWYNRRTFTLFFFSKRFVVRTSKVLYLQFLYVIPFCVRGGKRAKKE
jgi:hypothetical protein